jgi:hypothetical protein
MKIAYYKVMIVDRPVSLNAYALKQYNRLGKGTTRMYALRAHGSNQISLFYSGKI